jgi:hypothetical protein
MPERRIEISVVKAVKLCEKLLNENIKGYLMIMNYLLYSNFFKVLQEFNLTDFLYSYNVLFII